jgi:hypothetical protein
MMIGDKYDQFHDTDIKRKVTPFLGVDLGRDDSWLLEEEKEEGKSDKDLTFLRIYSEVSQHTRLKRC